MIQLAINEQKALSEIFGLLMDTAIFESPDSIAKELDWAIDDLLDFIVCGATSVAYPLTEQQNDSIKRLMAKIESSGNISKEIMSFSQVLNFSSSQVSIALH